LEVESHGEEKEQEELESEDLKRVRSFEFDYALAAERSSAAFALEEPIYCWRNPSRLSLSPGHERRRSRACAMSQAMISALCSIEPRRPERPS
jgi:hypothetical protein